MIPLRGRIIVQGNAGANAFTFTARIGGHELTAGSYRLTATPNAGGRTGTPETISITLVV